MNRKRSTENFQFDGVQLIAAERERQKTVEDWTPEHDDKHASGQLRRAATCYVWHAMIGNNPGTLWPWEPSWYKPSDDPIRNLVKAGALIAAEIDRLQRVAEAKAKEGTNAQA